ncbi:MAG: alpha-E domain-containing protein [Gammaproteobacteria bacterium]
MLSKVAERMYWLGRYIERAENIARLVNVNASLQLDLPRGVKPPWHGLTDIFDQTEEFLKTHKTVDERSVIKFILADNDNSSSLISTVRFARENARTTREILPTEAFELITELQFFANERISDALGRAGRHEYLAKVVNHCHQLTGALFGTMSHDLGYAYIRLGRNVERADMTTRILDVTSTQILTKELQLPETYDTALWMSVLRSMSAYQMYRQHVTERVNAEDVVEFLLQDSHFPRSVAHCIGELKACCSELPRNEEPQRALASLARKVADVNVADVLKTGLRAYIDDFQLDLAGVHNEIANTWFNFDHRSFKLPRHAEQQLT